MGYELVKATNTVLHTNADAVQPDADVSTLIDGMREVIVKHKGRGLAANQVGVLQRVIIVCFGSKLVEIINPVITKYSPQLGSMEEGCLSYPGKRVRKNRHKRVTVEGFDRNWKPLKLKLQGVDSVCVQHEVDHLNGLTII